MPLTLRSYGPRDFAALHKLDQSCFPAGISYSKITLRYFLTLPSADCVVAEDGGRIVGFIVSEENPPLAHIITLDVDAKHRRHGVASALLETLEGNLALRGVRSILLETATNNEPAVAFWKRSEEHTSELQSRLHLVCRLLLEKKKSCILASVIWLREALSHTAQRTIPSHITACSSGLETYPLL